MNPVEGKVVTKNLSALQMQANTVKVELFLALFMSNVHYEN